MMTRTNYRLLLSLLVVSGLHIFMLFLPLVHSPVTAPVARPMKQIIVSLGEEKIRKHKVNSAAQDHEQHVPGKHTSKIKQRKTTPVKQAKLEVKVQKPARQNTTVRPPVPVNKSPQPQSAPRKTPVTRSNNLPDLPSKTSPGKPGTPATAKNGQQKIKQSATYDRGHTAQISRKATPLYQRNPPPKYPRIARKRGIEGTVIIKALVDRNGQVAAAEISTSSGSGMLDNEALKTVREWLFTPGSVNGRKRAMPVKVPIKFQLKK